VYCSPIANQITGLYCRDVKLNITATKIFASLSCHLSSKLSGNSDGRGILPAAVERTTSSRRPRAVLEGLGANTSITTPRMVTSSHRISTLAASAPAASTYSTTVPRARAPPREVSEERRLGWGKSVEDELQEAQCGAGGPGRQHRIMSHDTEDGDFQPPIQHPRCVHLQHRPPPRPGAAI
jgi:hypothetical protein